MTILSDLLFGETRNQEFKNIAEFYHNFWTSLENVKKVFESPITTCTLCSAFDVSSIRVLGLYYDSMPFNSVTLIDACVVTIMCLAGEENLSVENHVVKNLVEQLHPDVIRNHYFLNLCDEREKSVNDWDVIEMLKSLMLSLKTSSASLRQFANLTKLLKNVCQGKCNTFICNNQLDVIEKQQMQKAQYFISEKNRNLTSSRKKKNNTCNRIHIVFKIMQS